MTNPAPTVQALRSHPEWFFVGCMAAGAGVFGLLLPYMRAGSMGLSSSLWPLAVAGLVAGFLVPERPWRWGVAIVLPAPILGVVLAREMAFSIVVLVLLLVMAVPVIGAAYCGRFLSGARKSPPV